jgi:flagellar biogenesis protein FliO
MDSLFGVEITGAARFILAFIIVLVLIAVTAWLVRRFGSGALTSAGGRGRQPRLAVIDAASVDARRKLILVRRDNVEHLVMIGGPTDVVIEPNIVRAAAATREAPAARAAAIPEAMPRPVPLEEATMWPLQPEPAPRPQRTAPAAAPQWAPSPHQPAEPAARAPHPDPLADFADALATQHPPRVEAEPVTAPDRRAAAQYATPSTDQNLAEMAQRLEAALRRPAAAGEPRLDIPAGEPAAMRPAGPSEPPMETPDLTQTAAPEVRPEPRPADTKKFYENLEQEMASLLGRPTGKT